MPMNPKLTIAAAILCASISVHAERQQLLESGSFEWPPVSRKKSLAEGADVSKSAMNADWYTFKDSTKDVGGKLTLGLTNEIFRTGRQCMFVQFENLTRPLAVAKLASDFVSIKPGETYHVSIWGRIDRKNPVTLDQRVPLLKLQVDWFMADREEQTGETQFRVQPIPGSANRPAMFVSAKWNEFFVDMKAPDDAAYMRVTWTWETGPHAGETNGTAYFDDATIIGIPGPKEDPFADEPEMAEETPVVAPVAPPVAPVPVETPKPADPENLAVPVSTPVPPQAAPSQKPKPKR
ncbi:MAG: hypothetical protein RL088_2031 [Verrucomicrobiota bacterium]|jgi:hypothetical protein